MTTAARTFSHDSAHWYYADGRPAYEMPKKDGSGNRPTTLADARRLNLLPSVTTILKTLHKQALVDWLIEQSCLAVLTSPMLPDEDLDTFVDRILHRERVQDQESVKARELGTDIHNGLEALFRGERITDELRPWIEPAYEKVRELCGVNVVGVEMILCGYAYAGKADFIGKPTPSTELLIDFKTTKKLPEKGSWSEHKLQLAAYARARCLNGISPDMISTGNLYISTVDCGKFIYHENPPWIDDYENGFAPLVKHWQWSTGYTPL